MNSVAKKIAYSAVELITLGRGIKRKISGVEIRLPVQFSRYYAPDYEGQTFDFIKRNCREGDTVFDLGAHMGLLTVAMAQRVAPNGSVFAFEPTPFTNGVLKRTVRINGLDQIVEVRNEAISNVSGHAEFYDTNHKVSNANSLIPGPKSHHAVQVETIKLDDFVASRKLRPAVIKIDVEGAELNALRGASWVIRQFRPALWLALHPEALKASGSGLQEIWNFLVECNLIAYSSGEMADEQWFCRQTALFDVELQPAERSKSRPL